MSKSPEKLGEIIQSRLFQMRKRSDRFFKGLETDLKRLNKMTTRVTNKLYDQVLSSLETIPGTSMPINTVGNLSQVSTLMQGLDAIQNDYRQAYGQLIRNARLDMLEIVITREAALEKVLKDEEGIIEDRTLVSDQSFEMMDAGYQKTLQRMNVTLDKWKSFAYDTFYSGLIKGVPISLFKSWFFNENGTLKIGSSLDEESTYTAVQSIVEQRTAYLRGKAQENDWKFCWNSNPMDPLTKSECIDATIAGVISEAEMGSGYGFPPRHICRCEIVYTRPEWVRVNQGVNTSIEKSRLSLVQQLINAPRQKGKWTRNGKVVKAKDITRAKGNLMYKEVEDKLGLLADRGPVPDFDFDDFKPISELEEGGPSGFLPPTSGGAMKSPEGVPVSFSKKVESKNWYDDKDLLKLQKEVLEKAEGGEAFFVLDSRTGKSIVKRKGGKDYVDTSDLPAIIAKTDSESFITFHNHPTSSSFSPEDINVFLKQFKGKFKTNVVFGNDGTKYKIRFPEKFTTSSEDVIKSWYNERDWLMNKYNPKVISGEILPEEAWKAHSHEVMTNISKRLGFEYERVLS